MFVARTASGRVMRSSSANSSRFGSSSSTIASMTRSQSARSETSVVSVSRAERRVALVARQALLLDGASEVALDRRASALRELHRHLAADRLVPGGDADLRDARAHRSEPDDADFHAAILRKIAAPPRVVWAMKSASRGRAAPAARPRGLRGARRSGSRPAPRPRPSPARVASRPPTRSARAPSRTARASGGCASAARGSAGRCPPPRPAARRAGRGRRRPAGSRTSTTSARGSGRAPGSPTTSTTANTACHTAA